MNASGASLVATSLPLIVLLSGCASASPETSSVHEGPVIVGSGSENDRQAIEASDQRMFQLEQSGVPEPAASSQAAPTSPTSAAAAWQPQ
jgi:hypothetical protein